MNHLAVIMDGNGRWGKKNFGDRLAGHKKGAEKVAEITEECAIRGYKCLTLYAFSTENFSRSSKEVDGIFKLMSNCLEDKRLLDLIDKYSLRFRVAGDYSMLSKPFLALTSRIARKCENNRGMELVVCIAYGGTDEITQAVNSILEDRLVYHDSTPVTYDEIKDKLYTANLPDPDAVVRYGGEKRLSNFLPLQSVYSELIFLDKLWPEFERSDLDKIEDIFSQRIRRFGKE